MEDACLKVTRFQGLARGVVPGMRVPECIYVYEGGYRQRGRIAAGRVDPIPSVWLEHPTRPRTLIDGSFDDVEDLN